MTAPLVLTVAFRLQTDDRTFVLRIAHIFVRGVAFCRK